MHQVYEQPRVHMEVVEPRRVHHFIRWSIAILDLSPNSGENLPSKITARQQSSWITTVILPTRNCRGFSSEKKLQAKKAFKAYKRTEKVNIKHYHTENCRFADNPFLQAVAQENQTISYCGVNSHLQNGKYKRRIKDIQ